MTSTKLIKLLIINIFLLQLLLASPSCTNQLPTQLTNVLVFNSETHLYPLNEFFAGYNLTFGINNTQIQGVSIDQPMT